MVKEKRACKTAHEKNPLVGLPTSGPRFVRAFYCSPATSETL
jgi:hypothetical protein